LLRLKTGREVEEISTAASKKERAGRMRCRFIPGASHLALHQGKSTSIVWCTWPQSKKYATGIYPPAHRAN